MVFERLNVAGPNEPMTLRRFTFKKEPLEDFVRDLNAFLAEKALLHIAWSRAEEAAMVGRAKLLLSVGVSYLDRPPQEDMRAQVEIFRDLLPSRMEGRINEFLVGRRIVSVEFETIVKGTPGMQQHYDPIICVVYLSGPPRLPGQLRLKTWDILSPPEMKLHGHVCLEEELPAFLAGLAAKGEKVQVLGTEFRSYSYTPGFHPQPQDGAVTFYLVM